MLDLTNRIPKFKAYPPVPNWYSSNITAIVDPQLLLYASKNVIVVLDLATLQYFRSFAASSERDKVTAIVAHEAFCFTAGTDKIVRGWNTLLGTALPSQYEHEDEITTLKLMREEVQLILISGDKAGKIIIHEPFGGRKVITHKVKSEITCIATVHHEGNDYIAVGYNNGMIFIEGIEPDLSLTTHFQIAGDNDTIQSMDWQVLAKDSNKSWPLLATSKKNKKTISVWIFPSQNLLCQFKLPNPPVQTTEQQKSSVSIQLAWSPLHEKKLFLSSYIGGILCYNISSKPSLSNKERLNGHNRNVFTINWCNHGRNCITTSLDKQLIKWDMTTTSSVQILKTQGMFPYSLDTCESNEGQISIGMGDNSIKLWNFSNEGTIMRSKKQHDFYDATVIWKGLQGKIEKIKWHPHREGVLAYSNDYGRVGFYDIHNSKNSSFKTFHKHQSAPSIDWGLDMSSVLEHQDMLDVLVSCGGDGIIHIYNTNNLSAPPIYLNEILQEKNSGWFNTLKSRNSKRCTLKIDQHRKFLAFGHTDGTVEVYDLKTLKMIFTSNCQRHAIRTLDWKYHGKNVYLASGSDQGDIAIHNLSDIDSENIPDVPIPQPEAFKVLKGHKRGIAEVRWSAHHNKLLLVSGSDDNLVVVWDVLLQSNISVFNKHRGKVLCVCWSPLDPNVVFSGSEDRFVYMWNMDDFCCKENVQSQKSARDEESAMFNSSTAKKRKVDDASSSNSKTSAKKKSKKSEEEKMAEDILTDATCMRLAREAERNSSPLEKKHFFLVLADRLLKGKVQTEIEAMKKTLLSEEEQLDNLVVEYTNAFSSAQDHPNQPKIRELFFGDKNDVRQLIEIEAFALNEKETLSSSSSSYPLQNDFKTNLDMKLAIDVMQSQYSLFNEKQLDDSANSCLSDWILLALSPMVGKQSWLKMMLKQAKKLEASKQLHLSSACYIACGRIYDAIDVYRNNAMFREAIALAKLRLPDKDPIVDQIFKQWADMLEKGDLDYLTASCYLLSNSTGGITNATNVLARSGEEDGLFFAACLARVVKDGTEDRRVELWLNKLKNRLQSEKARAKEGEVKTEDNSSAQKETYAQK